MNTSKINLLEQRFNKGAGGQGTGGNGQGPWNRRDINGQQQQMPFRTIGTKQDSPSGWNFEFTEYTVVNGVHQLANDLWKDAQIFGPHQKQETSTDTAAQQRRKLTNTPIECKKSVSRTAELFSELTDKQKSRLEYLAMLYCTSLDKNLCENILDEVQLWFQLLAENYDATLSTFAPQDQVFATVPRRVYFVSKVLELQMTSVLMYIDLQVIQILYKNFAHRIPKHLRKMLEKIVALQQENKKRLDEMTSLAPVTKASAENAKDERVVFQSETEGRSNFLNNTDFNAFCKQRDVFYSIKDSWSASSSEPAEFVMKSSNYYGNPGNARPQTRDHPEARNSPSGYGKRVALKSPYHSPVPAEPNAYQRMKQLMQLNTSPSNLSYLATLCLSQCLLDYANYKSTGGIEMADESLRQMFSSNPSKFKQLENRFPSSKPSLNDPLAFFKYFTDLASSPELTQHLIDRCVYEITEIEKQVSNQEVRHWKDVLLGLNKSRHLAQILGYLYFKPYQNFRGTGGSNVIHSIDYEAYVQKQIKLRSYRPLPLDLSEILYGCVTQKRIIFTLPWIIDFLTQADSVSFQLPCFKKTLLLIVQVYRNLLSASSSNFLQHFTKSNIAFLRFCSGKLFTCPDFPTASIFSPDFKPDVRIKQFLMTLSYGVPDMNSSIINPTDSEDDEVVIDSLSTLGDILVSSSFDSRMSSLRTLLNTTSKVLLGSNSPAVNVLSVKHIKPVALTSAASATSEEDQDNVSFQMKLENSFFLNHSPSVKRTVEFISERVTSNFVKTLRTSVYPELRDEFVSNGICGQDAVIPCQEKVIETFKTTCISKLEEAIDLLLCDSVGEGVLMTCKQICLRKSLEKIQEWASTHINKDLFPAIPAKHRSPSKPLGPKAVDTTIQPLFRSLSAIQKLHRKIYQKRTLDVELLRQLLQPETLGNTALVQTITFDISLAIITFMPAEFTVGIQELFLKFWSTTWKSPVKVICPRNVFLFQQSSELNLTWKKLACLISLLLEKNVISFEDMEQECLAFLRCDWPQEVMRRLSEFSQIILSKNTKGRSAETEVIDWISWACSDEGGF